MLATGLRPLPRWPYPETRRRRWRPFSASWDNTMSLLDRELRHLGAGGIVLAAGFTEDDLRIRDGWPRAAAVAAHPGIELSFDSRHGRLVYATDVCAHWQDNVRAVALGLEALRAVDRHGVSRRGEQYAGWRELPSGEGRGVVIPDAERARQILLEAFGGDPDDPEWTLDEMHRRAVMATHPDRGGDGEAFIRVQAAYEFLKVAA